jgi:hypothetical protein
LAEKRLHVLIESPIANERDKPIQPRFIEFEIDGLAIHQGYHTFLSFFSVHQAVP